jgi:hypothetical protein
MDEPQILLLKVGDRINWETTLDRGYQFPVRVAGVVVKLGPKRVQIEIRERDSRQRNRWVPALKWVEVASISRRRFPCSALGEEMTVEIDGFRFLASKHPAHGHKVFPNGIFYGAIDDLDNTITAPCSTPDTALVQAHEALISGSYRSALLGRIACIEAWFEQGSLAPQKREAAMFDLRAQRARLGKLDAGSPRFQCNK